MNNKNKKLVAMAAVLLGTLHYPLEIEAKSTKQAPVPAPIVIEADRLYFNEETGDFSAGGKVQVSKDGDQVLAETLSGNTQKSEVQAPDTATLLQPGLTMTGTDVHYNYQQRTGQMQKVYGKAEKIFVGGQMLSLSNGQVTVEDAWASGCPAEAPHYYVGADKVEIWPGDKLIAHHARIVVAGKTLFTMPKLEKSLKKENETTMMPRIGYDSDDGFMIGQHLAFPAGKGTTFYTDLLYYTQRGFEPQFGMTMEGKQYTFDAFHGSEKNSDDEWVKKEQDYRLSLKPQRLGDLPLTATVSAGAGKWTDESVSGWRNFYSVYVTADPIQLNDAISLKLGTGYQNIYYRYNKTYNNILSIDAELNGRVKNTEAWLGFSYHQQTNESNYVYDRIDIPRELRGGFLQQIDDKNKLGMRVKYDMDRSRADKIEYIWRHNMHCVESDISYDTKKDRLSIKVTAVNW